MSEDQAAPARCHRSAGPASTTCSRSCWSASRRAGHPGPPARPARRCRGDRRRPRPGQRAAADRRGRDPAGRRPLRRARRPRARTGPAPVGVHHRGIDAEDRAGDRPPARGHGLLGLLIEDPHAAAAAAIGEHPASYGFPPHHPPMRHVPRRAGPDPRRGVRQPLPHREERRRGVHRRRTRRSSSRSPPRPASRSRTPGSTPRRPAPAALARGGRRDDRAAARSGRRKRPARPSPSGPGASGRRRAHADAALGARRLRIEAVAGRRESPNLGREIHASGNLLGDAELADEPMVVEDLRTTPAVGGGIGLAPGPAYPVGPVLMLPLARGRRQRGARAWCADEPTPTSSGSWTCGCRRPSPSRPRWRCR